MGDIASQTLSVVVITKNERKNLPDCLKSVEFAEEAVVVDAESTDGTFELAQAAGARVISNRWEGYAKQRQRGFDVAAGTWILWLDADERVSPELAADIKATVEADGWGRDGFLIPRRHYFLGDWLRHGDQYPGLQLRLVRKKNAVLRPVLVHETIDDSGLQLGTLVNAIEHFSTPNLAIRVVKTRHYARLAATEIMRSGAASLGSVWGLWLSPVRRIAYVYLKAHGYRDGWRGVLWAIACGLEQFLVLVHLLRLRGDKGLRVELSGARH